ALSRRYVRRAHAVGRAELIVGVGVVRIRLTALFAELDGSTHAVADESRGVGVGLRARQRRAGLAEITGDGDCAPTEQFRGPRAGRDQTMRGGIERIGFAGFLEGGKRLRVIEVVAELHAARTERCSG